MKKIFLIATLSTAPLFAMQDDPKKAFHEVIFTAAAQPKADWVSLLAQYPDAKTMLEGMENEHGKTPLHIATEQENLEAIRQLLLLGANMCAQDKNGITPIELALKSGRWVIKQFTNHTPLINAVRNRNEQAVKILLKSEFITKDDIEQTIGDPNKSPLWDFTALHWAINYNNASIVQLLINAGADMFAKTKEGHSAYHMAKEVGGEILEIFDRRWFGKKDTSVCSLLY